MCTYAEEAWHQEAYSEKEGGKFAEAGPPPVGSGVDTGVAGQVSQAHHPLRAARRHPRGLCAVGLFFNLLQPSLVRVLKGSLIQTSSVTGMRSALSLFTMMPLDEGHRIRRRPFTDVPRWKNLRRSFPRYCVASGQLP